MFVGMVMLFFDRLDLMIYAIVEDGNHGEGNHYDFIEISRADVF